MILELRRGDRVRVTNASSRPGYWPGEKGIVLWGPNEGGGVTYYVVCMDHDPHHRPLVFKSGEVEPDV